MGAFEVIPLRAFSDNYIWTLRDGAHAAVVDPGDAAPVYRLECWRSGDPRNWPALARRRIRALVSSPPRG